MQRCFRPARGRGKRAYRDVSLRLGILAIPINRFAVPPSGLPMAALMVRLWHHDEEICFKNPWSIGVYLSGKNVKQSCSKNNSGE